MKITDIQCIHIQIPKVSTNIIGGSVSYEGNPYRDEEPEHMNQFVGSVPHFGHSCSCIVKVYTDEGIVGIGEAGAGARCAIDKIRDNLIGCDVYDITYKFHYTMRDAAAHCVFLQSIPDIAAPRNNLPSNLRFGILSAKKPVCRSISSGGKCAKKRL